MTSRPRRAVARDPERHAVGLAVRDLLAPEVQRLVLDEHDRAGVVDRAAQQPGGVGRAARHHDLEPGDVGQPRLEALRVLRRAALAGAALRAQHERHAELPARHRVRLRRRVDELVERERDEVDVHDLEDRPQPRLGGADGDARRSPPR